MRTFIIVSLLALPLAGQENPTAPADQIASLTWLQGEWTGQIWGGTFHSTYTSAEGGMVLSVSKLIVKGKVQFHEFEVFHATPSAALMSPYPRGRAGKTFKLTALDGKKATFENPQNDHPQKIVYWRKADDNLVITLSGKGGKQDVFDLKKKK